MIRGVVASSLALLSAGAFLVPDKFFAAQGVAYRTASGEAQAELRAFYTGTSAAIAYVLITGECSLALVVVMLGAFVAARISHRVLSSCQPTTKQQIVLTLEIGTLLLVLLAL